MKRKEDNYPLGLPFTNVMETTNPTLFLQPPAAHQNPPQGLGGLNPIDRLYSMQTSYFCGEDVNEP